MSNTIKSIYAASLFRNPSDSEIAAVQLDLDRALTTPALFASEHLTSSEASEYQKLGALHLIMFNRAPTYDELLIWGGILRSGFSTSDLTNFFLQSELFAERVESADSVASLLQEMVSSVSSFELSNNDAQAYANQISLGELSADAVISLLLSIADTNVVGVRLLTSAINGVSNLTLDPPLEDSLPLSLSVLLSRASDTPTNQGEILLGTENTDLLTATSATSSIQGLGGDDQLFLSENSEMVIFEASAPANGTDLIRGFSLGDEGDVLDFSAYLNQVNSSAGETSIESTSTSEVQWSNGDIITVSGNGLTSASSLATLFGTGSALANPSEAAKAVVITADIIGDASIWYLLNQTDVTNITADEFTLVGTLEGINNIQLVGFTAYNLGAVASVAE